MRPNFGYMTKRFIIAILSIVAIAATSCTHKETTYYPDGRTQSVIQYRGKKEHGKTVYFYHNPNIVEIEVEMKNGKRNGEFRRYFKNGLLDTYCVYENDSIEGVEVVYLANGCKSQENTYLHGRKDGPHREYHIDGNLMVEGAFKNDLIDGPWTYYDERGVIVGEGEFHEGTGEVTFYDKFGRPERTVRYKKNKKDGKEVYYTPSGQIYREITFKEDRILSDNIDSTLLK